MVKKKPTKKKEVKKLTKTKKLVVSKPKKTSAKTRKLTKKVKNLNLPKTISPQSPKSLKQKFTTGYYHCLANN